MASEYLHALSCSKCGASLPARPGQQLLSCQYCGQSHAFVPPPPAERRGTRYSPGEAVAVEWGGHWWPARVQGAVGDSEWRIHFDGWSHQWDIVVGPSRIRHISNATRPSPATPRAQWVVLLIAILVVGVAAAAFVAIGASSGTASSSGPGDPNASYQQDQAVDIYYGASWYPGRVLATDGNQYEISYDGWSSNWNEWVTASRLRPHVAASTPQSTAPASSSIDSVATRKFSRGDAVDIEWRGTWYPGKILKVDGNRYRITYDGWASSWDEWVRASRLRPRSR